MVLTVKTVLETETGKDVRRWEVPESEGFNTLVRFVQEGYTSLPEPFQFVHLDEENDRVTIASQTDLLQAAAAATADGEILKIYVIPAIASGHSGHIQQDNAAGYPSGVHTAVNDEEMEDAKAEPKPSAPEDKPDFSAFLTELAVNEALQLEVKTAVVQLHKRIVVDGEPLSEAFDTVVTQCEQLCEQPVVQHIRGFLPAHNDQVARVLPFLQNLGPDTLSGFVNFWMAKLTEHVRENGELNFARDGAAGCGPQWLPFMQLFQQLHTGAMPQGDPRAVFGVLASLFGGFGGFPGAGGGRGRGRCGPRGRFGHGHRGRGRGHRGGHHPFAGFGHPHGPFGHWAPPAPPAPTSEPASGEAVHSGVQCDGCGVHPISGVRYKCSVCPNFDLCATCEAQNKHPAEHPLIKIARPVNASGPPVHEHVRCDNCGVVPIVGARYKCAVCPNFDLCGDCESKSIEKDGHVKEHPLIKLNQPDAVSGVGFQGAHEFLKPWKHGRGGRRGRHGHRGRGHHGPHGHGHHGHGLGHGHHGFGHHGPHGPHGWGLFGGRGAQPAPAPTVVDAEQLKYEVVSESFSVDEKAPIVSGQVVVKQWKLKNVGTAAWPAGTKLVLVKGNLGNSGSDYVFPVAPENGNQVAPGQVGHVSAVMEAPQAGGAHEIAYRLQADGVRFGAPLNVRLDVTALEGSDLMNSSTDGPNYDAQLAVLAGMGFTDVESNRRLLAEHGGAVQPVVLKLLGRN